MLDAFKNEINYLLDLKKFVKDLINLITSEGIQIKLYVDEFIAGLLSD